MIFYLKCYNLPFSGDATVLSMSAHYFHFVSPVELLCTNITFC